MQATSISRLTDLGEKIRRLELDREQHAREIAAIDQILAQVSRAVGSLRGIAELPEMREHTADAPRLEIPVRGRRGKFQQTGEQSVLGLIRQQTNPTTAEINAHWRREGRRGAANVILLRLLKCGLIRREADPNVRGSRYCLTEKAEAHAENNTLDSALRGEFVGLLSDANSGARSESDVENLQVH
jgi:hypothetical protein